MSKTKKISARWYTGYSEKVMMILEESQKLYEEKNIDPQKMIPFNLVGNSLLKERKITEEEFSKTLRLMKGAGLITIYSNNHGNLTDAGRTVLAQRDCFLLKCTWVHQVGSILTKHFADFIALSSLVISIISLIYVLLK